MWIEELSNGRYKYIERYTDPYTGKYKRVSITLDRNTRQAEKQAQRELQAKIDTLLNRTDTHDMTYGELLDEYLIQWLPTVKDSTKRNAFRYDRYISKIIPTDTLLSKIDKRLIRQFINQGQELYTYHSLKNARLRLHAVLDYAVSMDYITINPTDKIQVPKPVGQASNTDLKFLTVDEIRELTQQLEKKKQYQVATLVKLMAMTGLRVGEATALTKNSIDFDKKIISVTATLDQKTFKLTPPKTRKSERIISISDNIIELLNNHIKQFPSESFIFTNKKGQPMRQGTITHALKMCQMDKNIHTHMFRHSHISFLAEQGIPLKAIMDRVGHSDPKITLAIYSHTTQNMKQTINDRVNTINL